MILSFDSQFAEERFLTQSIDHATPENLYERGWAFTLLDQALETAAIGGIVVASLLVQDVIAARLIFRGMDNLAALHARNNVAPP